MPVEPLGCRTAFARARGTGWPLRSGRSGRPGRTRWALDDAAVGDDLRRRGQRRGLDVDVAVGLHAVDQRAVGDALDFEGDPGFALAAVDAVVDAVRAAALGPHSVP